MSFELGTKLFLVLFIVCFNGGVVIARAREMTTAGPKTAVHHGRGRKSLLFNVKSFGARADGTTDDTRAFKAAWKQACEATGTVTLVIPRGVYLIGPIKFAGPCKNVSNIIVHMKGYLKATTNLSEYSFGSGWVEFGWVEGLTLTGGGTFDGQGAKAWPYNSCPTDLNCKLLPTNVKFVAMNRTVVRGITSVDSKFFHIALVECNNFKGNSQVTVTSITCGPGHGISVGSLGRYRNEGDNTVHSLLAPPIHLRG
ncbi:hypothetical protein Q3G72_027402 [Acer saccharum]|nr:hypothetical protein Q3G72_027402 [Acer saccharum]